MSVAEYLRGGSKTQCSSSAKTCPCIPCSSCPHLTSGSQHAHVWTYQPNPRTGSLHPIKQHCQSKCLCLECTDIIYWLFILKISRLRSELDIVRGNTKVMSEMLTEMVPGQEDPSDHELLQVSRLTQLFFCLCIHALFEQFVLLDIEQA